MERFALFLDFDGTLVPLADRPGGISVPAGLADRLTALSRELEGRLALISGRYLEDIDSHLGPASIAMAGSHGLELRGADGRRQTAQDADAAALPYEEAEALAARHEGLLVERKPHGLGIHYRGAPELERTVAEFAEDHAARTGIALKHGKMVVELMQNGASKGRAVETFLRAEPFKGAMPIFIGDDLTDEDGFIAARDAGGFGILVGPRRETAARYRLEDTEAVYAWLGV